VKHSASASLIFLACLVFPGLLMGVLPVLVVLWAMVGSVLLWPLASFVASDRIWVFYAFWAAYYVATCVVLWLTVRSALRRLRGTLQ